MRFRSMIDASKAVPCPQPLLASNTKSQNGRDDFAIGPDGLYSGLPGGAATPSRSIADEATQRRYRQHFLGRDPKRKPDEEISLPKRRRRTERTCSLPLATSVPGRPMVGASQPFR